MWSASIANDAPRSSAHPMALQLIRRTRLYYFSLICEGYWHVVYVLEPILLLVQLTVLLTCVCWIFCSRAASRLREIESNAAAISRSFAALSSTYSCCQATFALMLLVFFSRTSTASCSPRNRYNFARASCNMLGLRLATLSYVHWKISGNPLNLVSHSACISVPDMAHEASIVTMRIELILCIFCFL